jgi:hypothetical protein
MGAGPMTSGWYYSKRGVPPGQHYGPFTWEQLVSYARSGVVGGNDLVWNEQLGDWRPASEIPGLAGYEPGWPSRGRVLSWLVPLIAVIVIGAGLGLYFGIWYHKGSSNSDALAFNQKEGEIFLEPSGVAGPDSFAGEQFVPAGPATTFGIPNPAITLPPAPATTNVQTSTTMAASTTTNPGATTTATGAAEPAVVASYPGDTPALYGGSKSTQIADKEGELRFLEQNPLKAQAFCEALNSDPTLRWSGGNQVRPDQLRAYFAELTPMLLTRDTRVTNYGYRNGHPTPRQSVLQAGQLVLVDRYGVPRKRCQCGNPLTPPKLTSRPPVYTGPRWPGFNPTTVIVVQQTTVIVNNYTVIDVHSGQPFGRPAGTDGSSDGPPPTGGTTTTTEASSTTTTVAPSTTTPEVSSTTTTSAPSTTTTEVSSTTTTASGSTTTSKTATTAPPTTATTTSSSTRTTRASTSPTKWYVRVYNVDDKGTAYVNGTKVAEVGFGQDSGWIDVTPYFTAGKNKVRFTLWNGSQGYTWGFAIKRNGSIVWSDVQGQANVKGANNNDQSRQNTTVYDHTISVSQT